MKKAIAILLTALLMLTVFVSCEGDVEDLFGDNITITFNGNGSTGGQMAALKVARGKEVRLTANAYKKSDSEFTGWNTKADGSGDKYKDEEFVYFEEHTTLYAQWSSGVTITFDANDGSGTMDPVKVSADVYELPENGFTAPAGYVFVRWSETAAGEVEYEVGDELEVTDDVTLYAIWAEILTNTKTSWTGRYTINDDLDYLATRIQVDNVAKLYLPDGLTLNAKKGITVTDGNTLVIDKVGTNGDGNLIATGSDESETAGIGGGENQAGGIITINGGTVTATGGLDAAGIGGGLLAAGGTITITGGEVTATGGQEAAGIGGGGYGNGGKVTINGGTVTANGGEYGAGIGGGNRGVGGTISISGGTVTANGGAEAAGIGGGTEGDGGEVTIAGGTVTATGVSGGAGIGGGTAGNGGTVTISGGTVTATGGENVAGIGSGFTGGSDGTLKIGDGVIMMVSTNNTDWSVYDGSTRKQYMKVPEPTVLTSSMTSWEGGKIYTLGDVDVTFASRITVTGSVGLLLPKDKTLTASSGITVTGTNSLTINGKGSLLATGSGGGAGIGGIYQTGKKDGGSVTINGGTVTANGSDRAAGIGGGYEGAGGTVTINGGTVTATGGDKAAGIGGGWSGTTGGTVTINGGTVEAIGGSNGAGIGGGYDGDGGTVTINNGTVTATGVSGGAGIGGGYYGEGGTVTISGGSVTANGGQDAHGIGRGYGGGSDETLTLTGVSMEVSEDNTSWTDYDGSARKRYMKTK